MGRGCPASYGSEAQPLPGDAIIPSSWYLLPLGLSTCGRKQIEGEVVILLARLICGYSLDIAGPARFGTTWNHRSSQAGRRMIVPFD